MTRCNIIIKDDSRSIQLYRHADGYPSEVIKDINKARKYSFGESSYIDAGDFSAAFVRACKKQGGGNIYIDGLGEGFKNVHPDCQYAYFIQYSAEAGEPVVEVYDLNAFTLKIPYRKDFGLKPSAVVKFSELKKYKEGSDSK